MLCRHHPMDLLQCVTVHCAVNQEADVAAAVAGVNYHLRCLGFVAPMLVAAVAGTYDAAGMACHVCVARVLCGGL